MTNMFNKYKGIFENNINELIQDNNDDSIQKILEIMYLMMYREKVNDYVINLYKILNIEDFVKVFALLGGKTVKFETKEKINDYLILSIIYYYKEIKGMTLKEIQKKLPFNLKKDNYISYGIRIKNFNNDLKANINKILEEKNKNGK